MENSTCDDDSGSLCRQHGHIFLKNPDDILSISVNPSFVTIVITHSIIFLLGVIGNTVVIVTWAGSKSNRSPTYTFLVSLAVADLLFLVMYLPLEILGYFMIAWDAGETVCKLRSYIEMLTGMASVLNLTAVSIDRFFVISYPSMATRFCTLRSCRIGLCVVWSLAIFLALPVCFSKEIHPLTFHNNVTSVTAYYCWDSKEDVAFHIAVYQLIAMFVVPAIFMTCCYTCVIRELWSSTRKVAVVARPNDSETEEGKYSSSNQTIEGKKKVIKMLILVIVLFYDCWGPRLIMNVMIKYGLSTFTVHIYRLREAAYLLSFLHSAINPIIYVSLSTAFRRTMFQCCKDIFCGKIMCYNSIGNRKGHHPHTRTDPDSYVFSSLADSTMKSKQLNSIVGENSEILITV